jgi:hypothetical protein
MVKHDQADSTWAIELARRGFRDVKRVPSSTGYVMRKSASCGQVSAGGDARSGAADALSLHQPTV